MNKILGALGIGLIGIAAIAVGIKNRKVPSNLDEAYSKAMKQLRKEERELKKTKSNDEVAKLIKEKKQWLDKEFDELRVRQLADIQIV